MTSNGNTNGNAQVAQPAVKQATNVSIEDLYKYFGVLADAKEDAGKVYIIDFLLFSYNVIYFFYFE